MISYYKLTPIKLGCEVRGIDLKTETRKEVIERIKEDVTEHRMLIFKDQRVITGDQQVHISEWFGEVEDTFYKHEKSPHPKVARISNDPNEGYTGVGRTGWHIDGTFQYAPNAYSLYYMASVPKEGATVFAPLTEVIEDLSPEKYAEWDRLWMVINRRTGPIHPLIYTHPRSKKKWEEGDFIISDNCAVAHEASPETQTSRSQVGLRVLHRTTVHNPIPPAKTL
ncbi:alpha-ketoglutarate-dependent sulfate ester dioxygenase-like isoform X3 [Homalodisca vitripennis]|uniref:alpha-ketoglutarate-dependent sulfate ester dioxygenase-like isoform X3 n=1 Tax=Homalodisca vitripennis TaxID=197043 RepID=UPI001EEA777D|nr:alpha-ketoglutarate-dependent sulfate ester dioxygenase-like isoform X3 [Homalodisca vitripennis]